MRMSYLLPNGPEIGTFSDSMFAKWFANFDENVLRPLLIFNYGDSKESLKEDLIELSIQEDK